MLKIFQYEMWTENVQMLKSDLSTKWEPDAEVLGDHGVHDGVYGVVQVRDQAGVDLVVKKRKQHSRKTWKKINFKLRVLIKGHLAKLCLWKV